MNETVAAPGAITCPNCQKQTAGPNFCTHCRLRLTPPTDQHTSQRDDGKPGAAPASAGKEARVSEAAADSAVESLFAGAAEVDAFRERALPSALASAQRPEPSLLEQLTSPDSTVDTHTPATWGYRGTLNRLFGGLLRLAATDDELADRDASARIRLATWPRTAHILVANPKGGVGCTVASLLIGGTLAIGRTGSVAIWDACDGMGSLTRRAEGNPEHGLGELLTRTRPVTSNGELASYLVSQSSTADVLGTVRDRRTLTNSDADLTQDLLDRYYRAVVADTGQDPHSPAFQAVLARADAVVIPTTASPDALVATVSLLEVLYALSASTGISAYAQLADTATVLIMHDGRAEDDATATKLHTLSLKAGDGSGRTVLDIPHDPHIATGGPVTLATLSEPSRVAWRSATTHIAHVLTTNIPS